MAHNQTLKLNVKSGEKYGKNFWNKCGVVFVHTNDAGDITSITVKHDMFPTVEMAAFGCPFFSPDIMASVPSSAKKGACQLSHANELTSSSGNLSGIHALPIKGPLHGRELQGPVFDAGVCTPALPAMFRFRFLQCMQSMPAAKLGANICW